MDEELAAKLKKIDDRQLAAVVRVVGRWIEDCLRFGLYAYLTLQLFRWLDIV